jgi:hypothetical protein
MEAREEVRGQEAGLGEPDELLKEVVDALATVGVEYEGRREEGL